MHSHSHDLNDFLERENLGGYHEYKLSDCERTSHVRTSL